MTPRRFPGLLHAAEPLDDEGPLLTRVAVPARHSGRVGLLTLCALVVVALAISGSVPGGVPVTVEATEAALQPALPRDLIAATRGPDANVVVTGARAEAINASLPFAEGPVDTARPFSLAAVPGSVQARAVHCLAQAVYYEAGFEPIEGRRAVAQVVLNRVRHPAFPNSICGVVYDGASRPGCQFSFACDGSLRRAPAAAAWVEAERVAREALAGQVASTVGTATHYHASYVAPHWAPRLRKLVRIGAHIFYAWPGTWGRTGAFTGRYAGSEGVYPPAGAAAEAFAIALPTHDPTDRRAPEDVGGRLDVTKGWTLSIPSPAESRARFAGVLGRQEAAPDSAPVTAAAPSGAE